MESFALRVAIFFFASNRHSRHLRTFPGRRDRIVADLAGCEQQGMILAALGAVSDDTSSVIDPSGSGDEPTRGGIYQGIEVHHSRRQRRQVTGQRETRSGEKGKALATS
jgi:hypothetical protein